MKKVLLIIAIIILAACSMSPGPTNKQLKEEYGMSKESIQELRPICKEIIIEEEVQDSIKKVATKISKRVEKKEEAAKIQNIYDDQQKNIIKQIETLEHQQIILDSLLKIKKTL